MGGEAESSKFGRHVNNVSFARYFEVSAAGPMQSVSVGLLTLML